MNKKNYLLLVSFLCLVLTLPNFAQFASPGFGGGVSIGGTLGYTDFNNQKNVGSMVRAFLRYGFISHVQAELGAGIGVISETEYRTLVKPIELRLIISPLSSKNWNPYFYGGIGYLNYSIEKKPSIATPGEDKDGWMGVVPVGLGLQFSVSDNFAFEMTGGYNFALKDNLDAVVRGEKNDGYYSLTFGFTAVGEDPYGDPDGDGLTNKEEKELRTNPKVADTDGDGLNDGDEVLKFKTDPLSSDTDADDLSDGDEVLKYKTNPLKADTDGDGLSDKNEILTYHTDPLKADTDSDDLKDGDEVIKYKTDPLKTDTDTDGLSDGDEVLKYKTDPLKTDTDGDGLTDSEEVLKYKTNPLNKDTDGGSVDDLIEVKRGTDPLKAEDDVVKVGVPIILEGITFATGKADITTESEATLEKALKTLTTYNDISVEIGGYTDNVGNAKSNQKLSERRATSVRDWLISKGIDANRLTAAGYGQENPVVPNDTKENKQKNRRIEFKRIK